MTRRAGRDWAVIGGVLVGVPMVLCAAMVFGFVKLVEATEAVVTSSYACAEDEDRLAASLTGDGAARELVETFPDGPAATESCNEDGGGIVTVDVERLSDLPVADAGRAGEAILVRHGWRDLGGCYVKRVAGRKIWAYVDANDRRSDAGSVLLMSMTSSRGGSFC